MLGVISIIIEDPEKNSPSVHKLLSENKQLIRGRMGLPFPEQNNAVITIVVEGDINIINTLCGKIGKLAGTAAKAVFAPAKKETQGDKNE